jgi:hypothetical protein
VLEKLIIVDYQEGSGGEFIASFISAHFGQELKFNLQQQPNGLQKWLNSYSLILSDWEENFEQHLHFFFAKCKSLNINKIAVPYHLYKWPQHEQLIKKICPTARFVKIDAQYYQDQVLVDHRRKVLDRVLGPADFGEIQFFLAGQEQEHKIKCLKLLKQGKLTLQQIRTDFQSTEMRPILPSKDIVIDYGDFFVNFDQTNTAYEKLCRELHLNADTQLLDQLLQRNKKNLQDRAEYLSI